jgi:hypothetical protein
MGNDLFAALMLARDICSGDDSLTKTGVQHRTDNDSSLLGRKKKATDLRGDVAIAGIQGASGGKGKGGGKGKMNSMVAAAATISSSFSRLLDDGLGAGDKE